MLSVKSHLLVRCDLCAHKRTFWQASVEHLSFYLFMVSCDEFCRVKTQYNSKILGITWEGELSVYAQSNLCEKWDITHIIIGHQLNGQQLEPKVNLAKKGQIHSSNGRRTVTWYSVARSVVRRREKYPINIRVSFKIRHISFHLTQSLIRILKKIDSLIIY